MTKSIKITTIMTICFIPVILFSQVKNSEISVQSIQEIDVNLPNPKIFTEFSDKPDVENGNAEVLWDDDSLKAKGKILNSLKSGNWIYFYQGTNGTQKLFEGSYLNDKRNGIWKEFSEKGKLIAQVNYRNGFLNGEATVFYETGIPYTIKYFSDGVQVSKYFEYYPKGNLKETSLYKNGEKTGPVTLFYPSGKIQAVGFYNNGIKDGKWQYNDEKGILQESGTYSNGIKTGTWTNSDKNSYKGG
jgi:antitoxin component YwqK of YwqJK toxin-antitoxin module